MRSFLVILAIVVLLAPPGWAQRAPLPVRNQMPMSAALLDFVPLSAQALGKGVVEGRLSYHVANMIMWESERGVLMRMDLESHTVLAELAYGLDRRTTVRAGFGYRWHIGGFLDGFIEDAEEVMGIQSPWSRRHTEENETDWLIREDGQVTYSRPDPADGVTDLTLEFDWQALHQRGWRPATALRLGVKVPTASRDDGLGSGGFDWGAGVAFTWEQGRHATHINLDGVLPADHRGLAGTAYEETGPFFTATFSQVVGIGDRWQGILQTEVRNNPYETTIDSVIEELSVEVQLGMRRNLVGGGNWFLALTENTVDKASPDFGVLFGIELRRPPATARGSADVTEPAGSHGVDGGRR